MSDGAAAEFTGMQIQWPKDERVDQLWPEQAVCDRCGETDRCVTHPQPNADNSFECWCLSRWETECRSYYEKTTRTITGEDKAAARQLQEIMSQKKRKAQVIKEEEAHATSTSSKRVKNITQPPPAAKKKGGTPRPPPGKPPAAKEERKEEEYDHEEYSSKCNWAKWRTEPCKWAKYGECKFGEHCWFIH